MKIGRIVTTTTLVMEALKVADDLLTVRQLVNTTGRKYNQVLAALIHLRAHRVVDVVVQQEVSHWFLTGEDTRHHHNDEYLEHIKPRRKSRVRKIPPTLGPGDKV